MLCYVSLEVTLSLDGFVSFFALGASNQLIAMHKEWLHGWSLTTQKKRVMTKKVCRVMESLG